MSDVATSALKNHWRRWLRQIARPPSSMATARVLMHLGDFLDDKPGAVLTYRPMPGELDLDPLLARTDRDRFHVTRTNPTGPLTVHKAAAPTELHRYGFKQPNLDAEVVAAAAIQIVLVPAVAFGVDGSRIGHGAGYYDHLLPTVDSSAALVGVAYESIVAMAIPVDDHDVSMTHLVTEAGIVTVGRSDRR